MAKAWRHRRSQHHRPRNSVEQSCLSIFCQPGGRQGGSSNTHPHFQRQQKSRDDCRAHHDKFKTAVLCSTGPSRQISGVLRPWSWRHIGLLHTIGFQSWSGGESCAALLRSRRSWAFANESLFQAIDSVVRRRSERGLPTYRRVIRRYPRGTFNGLSCRD